MPGGIPVLPLTDFLTTPFLSRENQTADAAGPKTRQWERDRYRAWLTFGLPDLLVLFRRCFLLAFRTFLRRGSS
jgi:hypothetical protein